MSTPPSDHDRTEPGQAASSTPTPSEVHGSTAPTGPVGSWPPPRVAAPEHASVAPQQGPLPPPQSVLPTAPRPGSFRRGFGLGAGAGLGFGVGALALTIVGALLSTIALVAAPVVGGLGQGSSQPLETIWGNPTAKHTLRAIPVHGAIMADPSDGSGLTVGTYGYEVAQVIDSLTDKDADGIVLLMNTPGGSITGSRAIADAVDRYRVRTGNQVFAHVQGLSASGGMYTMANADRIVADHGSLVGSIGVISGPFTRVRDVTGTTGTLLESGVTTTGGIAYEYLSMGRDKDFGNPYRDMRPEERDVWMGALASEYDGFVNWVADHRGIPAATIRDTYGAHMFGGQTAVANKYVDAIGGQDEAFRDFATRAGVNPDDTQVERAVAPGPLSLLLGAQARPLGVAPAAEPQGGEPARATSRFCAGTAQVLAYQGDIAAWCG